jgi:hypothetical protein
MSRPTARPGTGAPCSGVRPLSTMAAPSLSPDQVPANAAGYAITSPDPHSRAEVSSPSEGHSNATAPWPWTGALRATSGRASPHLRERPRRSDAQWQGGITASQPRIITSQHPHTHTVFEHQGAFATMRKRRNHHLPSHRAHHVLSPDPPGHQARAHMPSPLPRGQHTRWPTRPPALSFRQG